MEVGRIRALAAAASILMMQGCEEQRERHIPVAHCDRGELYVRERVQPASGEQHAPFVDLSLYYIDQRGQQTEISASPYEASMFEDFAVSVLPDKAVWAKVPQGRMETAPQPRR